MDQNSRVQTRPILPASHKHYQKILCRCRRPSPYPHRWRPKFASNKFRQFLRRWGINHALSTPHYPQSNGHAESAVKAMKSLVAKSAESGDIDSDEFCEGLLKWLNTPKAAGLSPAEILYGHPLRSIILAKLCSYKQFW